MSASSGRDAILLGELQSDLDAKGFKIVNADLSESTAVPVGVPTISATGIVLKGDGGGNAIPAIPKIDFWDTTNFIASGSGAAKGLVPAPSATAGTTKFLREDGGWAVPAGVQNVPIITGSTVLKGSSGNAVAATVLTDYWDGTVFVGSGASHAKGLVPDPGASAATTHYLREDGTWAIPPAASGVTIAVTSSVIKGDGAGGGIAAVAGTDFVAPSTALTRLTAATTVLSTATPTVNWNTTTSFSQTLAANTTYTFSNNTDSFDISIAVTNTASNYTVTWPAGIKWQAGVAPTQTVGAKTDLYTFKQFGAVIYGSVHPNHS